ncbi:Helix-turn-helix domain-containing protein [Chitinophaga sp. YR573]|uniref:helix-turn-helix domain-containing protein n=1 Tax=Chitinophaga sp. YR573 TaxID=1881040 RepID=UPI0008B457EB|nr:helix-turn-helix transcriptional regulator [Chitinophaga sp. YR573]SEW39331.1 Helix-turn-helix domain-containing protein [Chitinophaga sp. YR573]
MEESKQPLIRINSITEMCKGFGFSKPTHPLISVIRFEDLPQRFVETDNRYSMGFYTIMLKEDCKTKIKYGQTNYDFDEGVMLFMAPGQVVSAGEGGEIPEQGWMLIFHPDLILGYPLGEKISEYGFFYYEFNEALILSEIEKETIESILEKIYHESRLPIDASSQDILISQVELLLNYCNRYYKRQFIVRKPDSSKVVTRLETVLKQYFNSSALAEKGMPTVSSLAEQFHMSPKYFSDMLKMLTGETAQQHIHNKVIEKAKLLLTTTELSVSEISFQLGFEYAQSFNKLFKNKTNCSPLEYRRSFN